MNPPLTLVAIITEDYLNRAAPFLYSLRRLESARRICVCLGWQPADDLLLLPHVMPHVDFRSMPMHWSADGGIFQHGRSLDVLSDFQDDGLYLYADADILVQRDFAAAELARFAAYDDKMFGAAWNAGEGDTLMAEAKRMGMVDDGTFGSNWATIPCFNTGIVIMRGQVWKRVRDLFESRVMGFWKLNPHRSRTQWLLCWCLWRLGLRADVLPGSLHSHGHHPLPSDVAIRNGIAYCREDVVLFRHAL